MAHYCKIVFLFLVFLIRFPMLAGQSTDLEIAERWTLERCISYALENNISVRKTRLQADAEAATLLQAKSSWLPSLSASASISGNNSRAYDNTGGQFTSGMQTGINSEMPIYQGGIISNQIEASRLELQKAFLNTEEAGNDIVISVTQAWMNLLFARENYLYYKESEATSLGALNRTKSLFELGSVTRQDVAEMQAQYASDRYSLVTSHNELDIRLTSLKTLLDIPYNESFSPLWPARIPEPAGELPLFSEIAGDVLKARPEIENSLLSEQVAALDLDNAKAGYLPKVSLSASASSSFSEINEGSFSNQMNDRFAQNIGLSVSIPLFSRNENRVNVTRSRINFQQARLEINNVRNQLLQTVEQLYVDALAQQSRYEAARDKADAARLSYQLRQEQFELGMLNAIALRQSRDELLNAEAELIQSRYAALLYQKMLDFYRGKPITFED